jgi:hypothetical protein
VTVALAVTELMSKITPVALTEAFPEVFAVLDVRAVIAVETVFALWTYTLANVSYIV